VRVYSEIEKYGVGVIVHTLVVNGGPKGCICGQCDSVTKVYNFEDVVVEPNYPHY
jgi:hypothetical protein